MKSSWKPPVVSYAGVHDYDPVSTCNDVVLYFLIRIINTKTSPYDVFIKYKANDSLFKAVSCKRVFISAVSKFLSARPRVSKSLLPATNYYDSNAENIYFGRTFQTSVVGS